MKMDHPRAAWQQPKCILIFYKWSASKQCNEGAKMDQDPRAAWHSFWLSCWEDNFQAYFTLMLVDTSSHNKLINNAIQKFYEAAPRAYSVDSKKIEIENRGV